jgi:hypothetical protein
MTDTEHREEKQMTLTTEQQAAIAAKVKSMTLPRGMGTEESACSMAAINLALTGQMTDEIPACMSEVVGRWIIRAQDGMPDEMRNSAVWKSLLPLAAGTGRDHERERKAIIKDWLFDIVLPHIQPIADAGGYGEQWRAMCEERTPAEGWAAAGAAAGAAAEAAWAAAETARAAWDAADWAAESTNRGAAWMAADRAARAAWITALASGDPGKAWEHFDPCGLLQKLVEVGK